MATSITTLLRLMKRGFHAVFGDGDEESRKKSKKVGSDPVFAAVETEQDLRDEGQRSESNVRQSEGQSRARAMATPRKRLVDKKDSDGRSSVPRAANKAPEMYLFTGEAESDYTDGKARMITLHDGKKQCAALLPTLQLSQALQTFVKTQHHLLQERDRSEQQDEILAGYRTYAQEGINKAFKQYESLEAQNGQEAEIKKNQKRARFLERKLKRVQEAESQQMDRMREGEREERSAKLKLAIALAEIFDECRLLPMAEHQDDVDSGFREEFAVPESSDVSNSQPDRQAADEDNDGPAHATTETSSARGRADAWQQHFEAGLRLEAAEREFDDRVGRRQREADAFHRRVGTNNPPSETAESFDVRHVQRGRNLTRELIEAEEEVAAARAHALAVDAKRLYNDDPSSGFASDSQDGGGSAIVDDPDRYINRPSIMKWLRKVPGNADPDMRPLELNDGDDHKVEDVQPWDSVSEAAQGSYRRRIDSWRKHRRELRGPKTAVLRESSRRKNY